MHVVQMAELFSKSISVISRHIANVFAEHELEEKSNLHFLQIANSDKTVKFFSLDVIISVGVNLRNGGAIVERDVKYAILFLSTHHPQV